MLLLGNADQLGLQKSGVSGWEVIPLLKTIDARRYLQTKGADLIVALMDRGNEAISKDLLEMSTISQKHALLVAPPEKVDVLTYQFRSAPVMILPMQTQTAVLTQILDYLAKETLNQQRMQNELAQAKRKATDEKLIAQAKMSLVSHCCWTEEKAHKYILKTAMDHSLTKAAAARLILRKVEMMLEEQQKKKEDPKTAE